MPPLDPGHPDAAALAADLPGLHYQRYLEERTPGLGAHRTRNWLAPGGSLFACREGSDKALVRLEDRPWDTEVLGLSTACLAALDGEPRALSRTVAEALDHCRSRGVRLVTCRLDYQAMSGVHALEMAGFRLMDAMTILLHDRHEGPACKPVALPDGYRLELHGPEHAQLIPALEELAGRSFSLGRVANDPNLDSKQKHRFYARLARSMFRDMHAPAVLCLQNGQLAGAVVGSLDEDLSEALPEGLGYLQLIAVNPEHRGKGLGRALLHSFLEAMRTRVRYVEIGTQLDNVPALNLYAKAPLATVASLVTLHAWL